jgi:transposase-like protein
VRVAHFAHYRLDEVCAFLGEGPVHVAAKHAIFHAVSEWLEGHGPSPLIVRHCDICRGERDQPLPASVKGVAMECRLESGRVADIVLADSESKPLAAVELYDSHAVDEAKEGDLRGIPWLELQASDAVQDPIHWRPLRTHGLRPFPCRCAECVKLEVERCDCAVTDESIDHCTCSIRPLNCPRRPQLGDCRKCPDKVALARPHCPHCKRLHVLGRYHDDALTLTWVCLGCGKRWVPTRDETLTYVLCDSAEAKRKTKDLLESTRLP